jgi:conjugative transposon TraM protein
MGPTHPHQFLQQRKFFLVLPLLALPFVFIIFFALGGGRGSRQPGSPVETYQGINLKLPEAHFKKIKEKDKLGLYEQAGKDSLKIKEAIKNDPYYKKDTLNGIKSIFERSASRFNQPDGLKPLTNPNEEKLMAKLAILENELNKNPVARSQPSPYPPAARYSTNPDLARLDNMMRAINTKNEEDPQLKQLGSLLDKIMLVQHPEKLSDSLRNSDQGNNTEAFPASTRAGSPDNFDQNALDAFYGLSDEPIINLPASGSMEAVVEETQTLHAGDLVRLRLMQDIYVDGSLIPKQEMVYGVASLHNERLKISIKSIRNHDRILPVALEVYDMDGQEGIDVPGSLSLDVAKESAGQAISSLGIESLDPSLGAQAASAGIQAAKTLLGKKVKQIKIRVKANYRVLLIDKSKK